jgi:predicted site-specific integrase-resolvase
LIFCNGHVNLKEWAEREGVSYTTARRWFASGKLPVPARKVGGLVLVGGEAPAPAAVTAVYARVSSADQRPDLNRQVARVAAWAAGEGLAVGRVVTEVGSALNGTRRKFLALLGDPGVSVIVVEHRDRFALVRDVTEILTSLCARLYWRRAAANRAARGIAAVTGDAP